MIRRHLFAALLLFVPTGAALAIYCGSSGPSVGFFQPGSRLPCTFWVAASGGSDSNAGTSAAPFATLSKLQTAVQSSGTKVACLMVGTYTNAALSFTSADNGETWETDPASALGAAVLDGTFATSIGMDLVGVSNFTINGLHLTRYNSFGIGDSNGISTIASVTIENNEVGFIDSPGGGAAQSAGIGFNGATNTIVENNYVHDTQATGIEIIAFNSTDRLTGSVIRNNVVINAVQTLSDDGAIYTNARNSGASAGALTISGNYVRDYGSTSLTSDMICIYLDDNTANAVVTGNICAPPALGAPPSGGDNNSNCFLVNGGAGNSITGNICDLGATSRQGVALIVAGGNTLSNNIVIANFVGAQNTSDSGIVGFSYYGAAPQTVQNNAYHNYAGGAEVSTGPNYSDASPQHYSAAQLGLACTNAVYSIAPGSAVLGSPVNFPPLPTSWGPSGFTIPSSSNHSC